MTRPSTPRVGLRGKVIRDERTSAWRLVALGTDREPPTNEGRALIGTIVAVEDVPDEDEVRVRIAFPSGLALVATWRRPA